MNLYYPIMNVKPAQAKKRGQVILRSFICLVRLSTSNSLFTSPDVSIESGTQAVTSE